MIGVTHCLWFDSRAEEAAREYVSIFDGAWLLCDDLNAAQMAA